MGLRRLGWVGLAVVAACSENEIRPAGDDDAADDGAPDDAAAAADDDDAAPGPLLQIQPPGFGFGERPVGCAGQVLVTLANAGDAPLSLFGVALVEPSGTGELALAEPVPPAVLAPGEGIELVVVHVPADLVPDAATLVVLSDDATASEQHAAFSGGARPAEAAVDTYLQEGNRSVDVLWVVDNSCSMALEQEALGDNFGSFLAIVESLDLDYHVGVVSTDRDDGGVLHGDVPVVTPSTPDREAVFADNVLLGQLGSGTEQGLDMALAALTGPNVAPGGANEDFLREAAGLRLVFVSDEDDSSWDLAAPADYLAAFRAVEANPDHVVASDITGGLTGCTSSTANADPAPRYLELTAATGGLSASICAPGWIATLEALGWLSQSFADTFELTAAAAAPSVAVAIDGVPAASGWTFDAVLNAVVFDPGAVPQDGSLVSIDYLVAQECTD